MWILFAILNPIADALRGVFSKKASSNVDSLLVSWINNIIPVIIFLPIPFLIEIKINHEFISAIIVSGTINIIAVILFHKAISKGEISQVVPILSFTPLFLLILSPILVGETIRGIGVIGVILIVIGSYLVNVNLKQDGIFSPIKSLVKFKGTRYMLFVAIIFSISSNYDKKGIAASSVLQYLFFINLYILAGTTIYTIYKRKLSYNALMGERKNLFLVGIITSIGYIVHMIAISMAFVAFVIALKRTSGMISVIFGHFFLNEPNIKERLIGSIIMFIGILFIVLF